MITWGGEVASPWAGYGSFFFRHYRGTRIMFKGQFLTWILLVWSLLVHWYGLVLGSIPGIGKHLISATATKPVLEHTKVPICLYIWRQKVHSLIMWVKNLWVCWFVFLRLALHYQNLALQFSLSIKLQFKEVPFSNYCLVFPWIILTVIISYFPKHFKIALRNIYNLKNKFMCILMTNKLQCECLEQCPSVAVLEECNGSSAQVPVICGLTSYSVFDHVGRSSLFF